jgi:hypothetical protein
VEFLLEHVAKLVTSGKFSTLISTDAATAYAKFSHESPDYVQWRLFGLREENPQSS